MSTLTRQVLVVHELLPVRQSVAMA